ncbi:MAG: TatD family hydrolase [Chitinispirillales bacterium]|jgi:TatD DNase family protein|nr:TatD family hydrolase [Chitinispirillales bacterium]
MFDTHCHLQDERIFGRLGGVVDAAKRAGVARMLCCGSHDGDWGDVAKVCGLYGGAGVACAYGVHPRHADRCGGGWAEALEGYLVSDPSAAVGEIGLDRAACPRDGAAQSKIFIRQLDIAEKYGRPVSIHCRRAWGELLPILRDRGGLKFGGAIHSYSGPPDLVGELMGLGCYVSFSGSILIPGGKRAAASLRKVSLDRLLIETDSPDIMPHGVAGEFNEPANLVLVVDRVAEILGESQEKIVALTYENGCRLF